MDERVKWGALSLNNSNIYRRVLRRHEKHHPLKEKLIKLEHIKLKNIYSMTDSIKMMKWQAVECEKMFAYDVFKKGLVSRIHSS